MTWIVGITTPVNDFLDNSVTFTLQAVPQYCRVIIKVTILPCQVEIYGSSNHEKKAAYYYHFSCNLECRHNAINFEKYTVTFCFF